MLVKTNATEHSYILFKKRRLLLPDRRFTAQEMLHLNARLQKAIDFAYTKPIEPLSRQSLLQPLRHAMEGQLISLRRPGR